MTTDGGGGQAKQALLRVAILGVLVGVTATGTAGSASGKTQQLRKITIAMIAVDATAQALYAKHRGIFRKHGIDAEIKLVAPAQTGPAIASGEAQFGAMPAGTLAQVKSKGAPFKAIAGGALYRPNKATTVLLAAPGSAIRSARDLVGKRVGLDSPFSIAHVGLLRWLDRNGVEGDDIELTTLGFPQVYALLMEKRVDAAVLPEPLVTRALDGGARRVALPFDAVCARDCLTVVWVARRDVDPDLAARFRVAVQRAGLWANDPRNYAASGRIIDRYEEIEPQLIAKMTRTTYATRLRVVKAQPWLDVFREYGLISGPFTPGDLVK
jgi:NitT/TauT family transport system substrate-binding protein